MSVLIVSRTRMGEAYVCVGAIDLETGRSLRLFKNGTNLPASHPIRPGDIWDLEYTPRPNTVPPHVEDVLVTSGRRAHTGQDVRRHLEGLASPWRGDVESIFDGTLDVDRGGRAFVREGSTLPDCSTGFWLANINVRRSLFEDHGVRYWLPDQSIRSVKYVGCEPPIEVISAGSLVRFSLARWYLASGASERRCYLQVSGWVL